MSCDLLVIGPHPDDVEIHCGGTIAAHTRRGASVVIIDATRGELGSRGTPAERQQEAAAAAKILGVATRENLDLGDGQLQQDGLAQRQALVTCIRRHQPQLILGISPHAHHPDHRALGELLASSIKACALHQFPGQSLPAVDTQRLLCYEAELAAQQSPILVPCTEEDWDRKRQSIACYGSQLYKADSQEASTSISKQAFQDWIEARGKSWGYQVSAPFAEAFHAPLHPLAVSDLRQLWPAFELS